MGNRKNLSPAGRREQHSSTPYLRDGFLLQRSGGLAAGSRCSAATREASRSPAHIGRRARSGAAGPRRGGVAVRGSAGAHRRGEWPLRRAFPAGLAAHCARWCRTPAPASAQQDRGARERWRRRCAPRSLLAVLRCEGALAWGAHFLQRCSDSFPRRCRCCGRADEGEDFLSCRDDFSATDGEVPRLGRGSIPSAQGASIASRMSLLARDVVGPLAVVESALLPCLAAGRAGSHLGDLGPGTPARSGHHHVPHDEALGSRVRGGQRHTRRIPFRRAGQGSHPLRWRARPRPRASAAALRTATPRPAAPLTRTPAQSQRASGAGVVLSPGRHHGPAHPPHDAPPPQQHSPQQQPRTPHHPPGGSQHGADEAQGPVQGSSETDSEVQGEAGRKLGCFSLLDGLSIGRGGGAHEQAAAGAGGGPVDRASLAGTKAGGQGSRRAHERPDAGCSMQVSAAPPAVSTPTQRCSLGSRCASDRRTAAAVLRRSLPRALALRLRSRATRTGRRSR